MAIDVRILERGEEWVLERVAEDVFDDPIVPASAAVFLADPRHHLAVAMDDDLVVGFASAVVYLHPDKAPPEMWVNEVGVAASHQRRGISRRLLTALLSRARSEGCSEAWVLTDRSNEPAMALYSAVGGVDAPDGQVMFTFPLDPE